MLDLPTPPEIRAVLAPGEQVLWNGIPKQGFMLRATDAFLIPFSLLWAGFMVFWETTAIKSGAPWFFDVWGIPFVLVGFYVVFGRFWADRRTRARTVYAVTDQRVLISSGLLNRTLTSLELRSLPQTNLTTGAGGAGTIAFGTGIAFAGSGLAMPNWPGGRGYQAPAFEGIKDAGRVLAIIRKAQQKMH